MGEGGREEGREGEWKRKRQRGGIGEVSHSVSG